MPQRGDPCAVEQIDIAEFHHELQCQMSRETRMAASSLRIILAVTAQKEQSPTKVSHPPVILSLIADALYRAIK